ncbi:hypothetical protein KAR91_18630 [Candidatus Pacearchaeota archaeon]|nr:hypothetical protein [Candidatus Pacearchaeota archaeon]
MAINNTFREIAIANSPKQPELVDSLLEESPILGTLPMAPTSNGLQHNYEEVKEVKGAGLLALDEALPTVDATTALEKIDVSVLGGEMEVGQDKARQFGSPGAYFNNKIPMILKKSGMDAETSILYNSIRAYALTNDSGLTGKHIINAGGSNNANYTMLAVKWSAGETTGLYDPSGFGRGVLMDQFAINGGNLYKDSTGRLVFGMAMKSYIGMQLANQRYVSAIVNIDTKVEADIPTEAEIDLLIESVRGQQGGNTVLYMHPKVLTALNKYKASSLQTFNESNDVNRLFNYWNGIPIMTSYNFLEGTEPNVT